MSIYDPISLPPLPIQPSNWKLVNVMLLKDYRGEVKICAGNSDRIRSTAIAIHNEDEESSEHIAEDTPMEDVISKMDEHGWAVNIHTLSIDVSALDPA